MGRSSAAPGDIDDSFDAGSGSDWKTHAIARDASGGWIVGGDFNSFNGRAAARIIRLKDDGSLDESFDPGTGANGAIRAVETLADGRILIGGQFTTFNESPSRGLAMLRPDGSLDSSFVSGFSSQGFSSGVSCLEELPDGNFFVGGYFTAYGTRAVGRFVLISPTGSAVGPVTAGADSHILDVDVLPSGKILVGGFFDVISSHTSSCVARLESDGRVDPSFSTGSNLGTVAYTVVGQPDGKVIIGGSFSNYFGLGHRYLGRLTDTGEPDAGYQGNQAPDLNVYGLTQDGEGRLIVAGQFDHLHGQPAAGIGRLLVDGSLDTDFQFNGSVSVSFVQEYPIDEEGRILAYGWSTTFAEGVDADVVRLEGRSKSPSEQWWNEYFGASDPQDEADWDAVPAGDGVSNLQKYALGHVGDPRTPVRLWGDGGLLFDYWESNGASGFRFRTVEGRHDAVAVPQWSHDLKEWSNEGLEVVDEGKVDGRVTWRVTRSGGEDRVFFRMMTGWRSE